MNKLKQNNNIHINYVFMNENIYVGISRTKIIWIEIKTCKDLYRQVKSIIVCTDDDHTCMYHYEYSQIQITIISNRSMYLLHFRPSL